jgi:hypothetical protein
VQRKGDKGRPRTRDPALAVLERLLDEGRGNLQRERARSLEAQAEQLLALPAHEEEPALGRAQAARCAPLDGSARRWGARTSSPARQAEVLALLTSHTALGGLLSGTLHFTWPRAEPAGTAPQPDDEHGFWEGLLQGPGAEAPTGASG